MTKALAALALVTMMSGVQAQNMHRFDGGNHQQMPMMNHGGCGNMWSQLNLSDAQQQQIQTLRNQNRQERMQNKAKRAQWQAHHNQVSQLVRQAEFDSNAAKKLAKDKQQWQEEQSVRQWQMQHDFYQVLTPEQQKKWQSAHDNCMQY